MAIPALGRRIALKLFGVIYITISPNRLTVRDVGTPRKYDDVPLLTYTAERPGQTPSRLVVAVGHESEHAAEVLPGSLLCHPFYHPRMLIPDFEAAEIILDFAVRATFGSFWPYMQRETFKPFIIIHPTVEYEDGFTSLELRTLLELGTRLQATRIYIWTGKRLLSDDEILSGRFPHNSWYGKAPWWQQTTS
jgi:hypothetical protein